MKRILGWVLVVAILLSAIPAMAEGAQEFEYEAIDDHTAAIVNYTGSAATVQIPEEIDGHTVTELRNQAFSTSEAKHIYIPNSVEVIQGNPFAGMEEIEIHLEGDNPCFALIDGSLYEKASKTLLCAVKNELIIPEGIIAIGDYACYGMYFSEVQLPSTLTNIGDYAFCNASGYDVPLDSGLETIGDHAFEGSTCAAVELVIPENIKSIGDYAFAGIELNSITLHEGLETIGDYAFFETVWPLLTEYSSSKSHEDACKAKYQEEVVETVVRIPSTVTEIGSYAFGGFKKEVGNKDYYDCSCKTTQRVIFDNAGNKPTTVKNSAKYTFIYSDGCPAVSSVAEGTFGWADVIFETNAEEQLSIHVGAQAFWNCKIDFGACSAVVLESVAEGSLFNVEILSDVTRIQLSDQITTLPARVFSGSDILFEEIPAQVQSIESEALYQNLNYSLYDRYDGAVTLPASVSFIAPDAFHEEQQFVVESGSYAESWVIENDRAYTYSGETVQDDLSWLTE